MKHRNPLFVAGFPYILWVISYGSLQIFARKTTEVPNTITPVQAFGIIGAVVIMMLGIGYGLYWLVSTARELRRNYNADIPNSFMVIIPLANYWWAWKYSAGVEKATGGKISTVLGFILFILLGSIGFGIFQDTYNKLPPAVAAQPNQLTDPHQPTDGGTNTPPPVQAPQPPQNTDQPPSDQPPTNITPFTPLTPPTPPTTPSPLSETTPPAPQDLTNPPSTPPTNPVG